MLANVPLAASLDDLRDALPSVPEKSSRKSPAQEAAPSPSSHPASPTTAKAGPVTPAATPPPAQANSVQQADESQVAEGINRITLDESADPAHEDETVDRGEYREINNWEIMHREIMHREGNYCESFPEEEEDYQDPRVVPFSFSVPKPTKPFCFDKPHEGLTGVPQEQRVYDLEWVRVMVRNLPVELVYHDSDYLDVVGPLLGESVFESTTDCWVEDHWPATKDNDTRLPLTHDQVHSLVDQWAYQVIVPMILKKVRVSSIKGGGAKTGAYTVAEDMYARLDQYIDRHPGQPERDLEYDIEGNLVKKPKRRSIW